MQITFITYWKAKKAKLKEAGLMLQDLFEKEGIGSRLIDVRESCLAFICEISIKDAAAMRVIVAIPAKRNWLCQLGIHRIELEYGSEFESITVSWFDGIGI